MARRTPLAPLTGQPSAIDQSVGGAVEPSERAYAGPASVFTKYAGRHDAPKQFLCNFVMLKIRYSIWELLLNADVETHSFHQRFSKTFCAVKVYSEIEAILESAAVNRTRGFIPASSVILQELGEFAGHLTPK